MRSIILLGDAVVAFVVDVTEVVDLSLSLRTTGTVRHRHEGGHSD